MSVQNDARRALKTMRESRSKTESTVNDLRGPIVGVMSDELTTEGDRWKNSKLALLNAVLDTMIPGLRVAVVEDDQAAGALPRLELMRTDVMERPRDLPAVLVELAHQISG